MRVEEVDCKRAAEAIWALEGVLRVLEAPLVATAVVGGAEVKVVGDAAPKFAVRSDLLLLTLCSISVRGVGEFTHAGRRT